MGCGAGVVAVVATMGVIIGTDIPMFLGAMIMGPLAAWCMKHVDKMWEGKIKPGFEMLVNNFSAGILAAPGRGGVLCVRAADRGHLEGGRERVDWLIDNSLLPLASLLIEPAKVLFLNNAINHGVLTPLGIQQAADERQVDPVPAGGQPGRGWAAAAYAIFGTGWPATPPRRR